jgi:hypothetical protein
LIVEDQYLAIPDGIDKSIVFFDIDTGEKAYVQSIPTTCLSPIFGTWYQDSTLYQVLSLGLGAYKITPKTNLSFFLKKPSQIVKKMIKPCPFQASPQQIKGNTLTKALF